MKRFSSHLFVSKKVSKEPYYMYPYYLPLIPYFTYFLPLIPFFTYFLPLISLFSPTFPKKSSYFYPYICVIGHLKACRDYV